MNVKEKRPDDIPEVREYMEAEQNLQKFKDLNPEFFEELDHLVGEYNRTREIAENAVRQQQVTCGPFRLMGRPSIKWDASTLVEEMGKDFFFEIGGKATTQVVYTIDNKVADSAASQGIIPQEVTDKSRKVTPRYSKPDKIVLP